MDALLRKMIARALHQKNNSEFEFREYLRHIDTSQLLERISQFRDLDFKRMPSAEISERFRNVLMFGPSEDQKTCALPIGIGNFKTGNKFFRVRKLEAQEMKFPLRGMEIEADAWEPPAKYVRTGRLNKDGEPLLYTSPDDLNVAIEETKIADGELFSAIVYEAAEPIKCALIGIPAPDLALSSDEQIKLKIVLDFLRHEFIRDVGVGTEHLYKISEALTKDNFDLPEQESDGWCYPSVAMKGRVNVCFRPHVARKKLTLLGVMICSAKRVDDGYEISVHRIAHGFDPSGRFVYHPIGSEVQKTVFPEIGPRSK